MTNPLTSDQRRAFLCAPDPARYYAASAIDEARQRIVRSIARNEGPALVVGATGMGKSLLLAVLAEQFEPRMSVVRLPGAQLCTRRALLQMILSELHLPYRHMDEGELRLSILEHLRGPASSDPRLAKPAMPSPIPEASRGVPAPGAPAARPRRMLVLVDEADALPTRLLEELRVLTNHVAHGIPLVSVVLAGSPVLEERFADPELEKFSQRLACRCYLAPLTRDETFQYVRSQVSAVGIKPEAWFDHDALAAIHSATGGAPRLVNQLCDQLVWLIEETGCQPLDAALVQQAWSDLQQLPAPWNTDAHSSLPLSQQESVGDHSANVIEFGELHDADDDDAEASHAKIDRFDAATELFVGHEYKPSSPATDLDDDLPASIPFDSARTRRSADLGVYSDAIDATQRLVEELDEFEMLELAGDEPAPPAAPEPAAPRVAENPFAEPFEEEEVLVDPYATFESQMLRGARQVLNRIDRTFAAELARCEARKSKPLSELTKPAMASPVPATNPATPSPVPTPAPAPAPTPRPADPAVYKAFAALAPNSVTIEPQPAAVAARSSILDPHPSPAVLVIEDDNAPAPSVVRGRQFRRLFTSLESAAARTHLG
jgi:type II secretory pathway predicted ATPase ExeA